MLKDQSPFKSDLHLRGVILPILQLCGSTEWRTRPETMNPLKIFNTTIIPIVQRTDSSFCVAAVISLDYNTPCFVLFGTDPSITLLLMALFHATSHHPAFNWYLSCFTMDILGNERQFYSHVAPQSSSASNTPFAASFNFICNC